MAPATLTGAEFARVHFRYLANTCASRSGLDFAGALPSSGGGYPGGTAARWSHAAVIASSTSRRRSTLNLDRFIDELPGRRKSTLMIDLSIPAAAAWAPEFTAPLGGPRRRGVIKCGCAERGCRLKPAFHSGRNAGFSRQLHAQFHPPPVPQASAPCLVCRHP